MFFFVFCSLHLIFFFFFFFVVVVCVVVWGVMKELTFHLPIAGYFPKPLGLA